MINPPPDGLDHTLLIRVTGEDHPGVTAGLMSRLSGYGARIFDVEQITIRGQLFLTIVVGMPQDSNGLLKDLLLFGWQEKMQVDFENVDGVFGDSEPGLIVSMVGRDVSANEFGTIAEAISAMGGNIDRITRLAAYPVMAYEVLVSGTNLVSLRAQILQSAKGQQVDISVQREGLTRRAKRLVVMDVDSTLIQDEVIELMAAEAGCEERVAEITKRAMNGEIDFTESLYQRVALLEGLDTGVLERVLGRIRLTPGARTFVRTLKRLGYRTAIVSGGFQVVCDGLKKQLEIDHAFANNLEELDGVLTGRVTGRVVDRAGKAELLKSIAELEGVPIDQVVAVGDGANDLDMLNAAGLGIAFNAKPVVRNQADTSINVPYLDAILFLLGVRREDIVQAEDLDNTDSQDPLLF